MLNIRKTTQKVKYPETNACGNPARDLFYRDTADESSRFKIATKILFYSIFLFAAAAKDEQLIETVQDYSSPPRVFSQI